MSKPKQWHRYTVASLMLILVLSCVALLYSASILDSRMELVKTADSDNRGWLVARLDIDHKALSIATHDLVLTQSTWPQTPDLSDLNRRFDVFYSRVETIITAVSREPIPPDLARMLEELDSARDRLAVEIESINAGITVDARDFLDKIRLMEPLVQDITNSALLFYIQQSKQARQMEQALLQNVWVRGIILLVFVTIAAFLVMRLWRQMEEWTVRMHRASGMLAKTFEASLNAVIVTDMDGQIMMANAAVSRVFGASPANFIGHNIEDMIVPVRLREGGRKEVQMYRLTGHSRVIGAGAARLLALRSNGQEFHAEMSVTAETDLDGKPILIRFIRDISKIVAAEQKLLEDRDTAERTAAARTAFLAMMSHDMRTPLQGMIAALDLIDTADVEAKNLKLIQTARDCSVRALKQINDVLELTRLGQKDAADVPFSPEMVANEIIRELTPLATARGTTLALLKEPDQPHTMYLGRVAAFSRAVYNLVGNAVKFTDKGDVLIVLSFKSSGDGQVTLHVAVRDNGIGIAAENQERIFGEFETVESCLTYPEHGTGLGLTIVRLAVQQMGGTINLVSSLGKGSTFSFDIELTKAPYGADAGPQGLMTPATTAQIAPTKVLDVLVVDDNAINLTLLAEMVRRIGHVPSLADNGLTALGMAAVQAFDAILMDVSMPVMDGYDATRHIRAGGLSRTATIIAVTAFNDPERADALQEAGVDAVLIKPATQADIAQALLQCADARMMSTDAGKPQRSGIESADLLHAVQSLSDVVGAEQAWLFIDKGLAEVVEVLQTMGSDPLTDDCAADALHRVAGSTAVLGLPHLSETLLSAEHAARAKNLAAVLDHCMLLTTAFADLSDKMEALAATIELGSLKTKARSTSLS
jgi:hypothetical protein